MDATPVSFCKIGRQTRADDLDGVENYETFGWLAMTHWLSGARSTAGVTHIGHLASKPHIRSANDSAENGNPKEPRNLLREYKLILKAAKLPEETRLHDLRHTAATRVGELGMEEYVIAAMLGHGKKNVTRRDAQALISQMRPIIEAAERLYHKDAGTNIKHG
jgi:integrase